MSKKIISRNEAMINGQEKYFTGKYCKHGHLCERYVVSRGCVECTKNSNSEINKRPKMTISRAKAKSLGLDKYFTGKSCCHGHFSERFVTSYSCVECHNSVHNPRQLNKKIYGNEIRTWFGGDLKVGSKTLQGIVELISNGKACVRKCGGEIDVVEIKDLRPVLSDMELAIQQIETVKPSIETIGFMREMEVLGLLKFTPKKDLNRG